MWIKCLAEGQKLYGNQHGTQTPTTDLRVKHTYQYMYTTQLRMHVPSSTLHSHCITHFVNDCPWLLLEWHRLFSHDGNLRILKFNCKCAFTIKFQNTQKTPCVRQNTLRDVFWNAHLKWRCRGVLQIRFSQITQQSLCVNDLTSESCFGGRS